MPAQRGRQDAKRRTSHRAWPRRRCRAAARTPRAGRPRPPAGGAGGGGVAVGGQAGEDGLHRVRVQAEQTHGGAGRPGDRPVRGDDAPRRPAPDPAAAATTPSATAWCGPPARPHRARRRATEGARGGRRRCGGPSGAAAGVRGGRRARRRCRMASRQGPHRSAGPEQGPALGAGRLRRAGDGVRASSSASRSAGGAGRRRGHGGRGEGGRDQARRGQAAAQEQGQVGHRGDAPGGHRLLQAAGVGVAAGRQPGVGQQQERPDRLIRTGSSAGPSGVPRPARARPPRRRP